MAAVDLARMLHVHEHRGAIRVQVTPVISQADGPTRKRRTAPVLASAASIWLLPWPSNSPALV
jgi:hypothetical protein